MRAQDDPVEMYAPASRHPIEWIREVLRLEKAIKEAKTLRKKPDIRFYRLDLA